MKKKTVVLALVFSLLAIVKVYSQEEVVIEWSGKVQWGGKAEIAYETGFMHKLMKDPDGGISLFNMELIENDSPGAGFSEKGDSSDTIWGKFRGKKIFNLKDHRTNKAWLVIYTVHQGKYPLKFKVNGHESQFDNWDSDKNIEVYRWTEFPAEWLKRGENTVEFYCSDAENEEDGWELYISRADEFENGGGDPKDVGETSFKSFNGGKSWQQNSFGSDRETRAEYTMRLSLDRYVQKGWLATPVIDLWRGAARDFIVPISEIENVTITIEADIPEGTAVKYYLRKGSEMSPYGDDWEDYTYIGTGSKLLFNIKQSDLRRRYIQIKAELATNDPLKSPVIKVVEVTAQLLRRVLDHENIVVVSSENPVIKYSSINWEWEKWDRPEFKKLRDRESLDEVIAGCRTEFDAQVKLLDYVTKRWRHAFPTPAYPGLDALSILRRLDNMGAGGFCLTFNNTLGGMCLAYGWQARHVNIVAHEVIEVWNDEYGKWIFMDADYMNNYNYDNKTAEPLDLLELHQKYLDVYFPNRPIDWMSDMISPYPELPKNPPVRNGSLTHHKGIQLSGFSQAAFMRIIPRNNWYGKPYPRPLNHGTSWWPWDGYINWHDERTPPKRQYSWHTDRPRDMWPDLNLVHVDGTTGFGNDRIFLRFETYTPNFSHFEIDLDDTGWKKIGGDRYSWLLVPGRNRIRVRAVNKLGAKGKPSCFVVNHGNAPLGEY